jgi:hypothetical protein
MKDKGTRVNLATKAAAFRKQSRAPAQRLSVCENTESFLPLLLARVFETDGRLTEGVLTCFA